MLSMIAAVAQNKVIGYQGTMPWRLSSDLMWFKKQTLGKPVVMGRKTYETLGKPLPGRRNIILSRQVGFRADSCDILHDSDSVIDLANDQEVMVIGGGYVYQAFLANTQRLYLTEVHATPEGDAFFPAIDAKDWHVSFEEHHLSDKKNSYPYTFRILDRIMC